MIKIIFPCLGVILTNIFGLKADQIKDFIELFKSDISKSDKLSFKIYPQALANISSLRIDLEVIFFL